MSAPEKLDTRARLLGYSRWAAIGLAVLAALTLALFSGETALRIAAFMAVIAVVLMILWITMNGDASAKVHLEEVLLDEIDMLRDDVRADITTAARATHRAIAEKVAHLHQNVESMRRDVDNRALGESVPLRPGVAAAPTRRAIAGAPTGVVHHTETVHVTTHQTYVDPAETERAERLVQRPSTWRPERSDRDDRGDWDREPRGRSDDRSRGGAVPAWSPYPERDERRSHADPDEHPYDDRDAASSRRSIPTARQPSREESWTDPRVHDYQTPAADLYDDSSEIAAWRNSRATSRDGGRDDDPADDERWAAMRSGDRWAEVRTDERGRELRMGERRTAIRADETGTQMRIVDRWSTVRRENPSPETPRVHDDSRYDASRYDDGHYEGGRYSESPSGGFRTGSENTGETRSERRRREAAEAESSGHRADEDQWPTARAGSDRSRLALPSSGPESAAGWMRGRDDRAEDDREPRRRGSEISGEVIRPTRSAEPIGRAAQASRDADRWTSDSVRDGDRRSDRESDRWGEPVHASQRGDRDRSESGAASRGAERSGHAERVDRSERSERAGRADRVDSRGADYRAAERVTGGRAAEPRNVDPRGADTRGVDPRGADPRGADPRGLDSRGMDPRSVEPHGADYRGGLDARTGDPRMVDPRRVEPRGADPRRSDSRALDARRDTRGSDPRSTDARSVDPRGVDTRGVDPREADHRRGDPSWSAPRRPESRTPDPRAQVRDYPPDEDNRWEREPSGGRSAVRRPVDIDPNDDRWR